MTVFSNGVGSVVEAVDEFKAERDQQGDARQHEWQPCFGAHARLTDMISLWRL
jgi:hypothetical protein